MTRQSIQIAFAVTLGLMASYSTIANAPLGLLVVPISNAFGIGRGTFGLLTGLPLLIGAALTPFAGKAMDRFGVRRVILPGIACFGVGQLLLSIAPLSVPLLGLLLLVQGAAGSLLSPLAYAKVVALWFHRRRGLMLGVSTAVGIGGGSFVCVVLVSILIASGGWRLAYLGTGIYVLAVGAIVVAPLMHEPSTAESLKNAGIPAGIPGLTRRDAIRTRPVVALMVLVVACIGSLTILMGHGPALLAGRGLNVGPYFLGCAASGSMLGQMSSGFLLDRIDSPQVGLPFAVATLAGGVTVLHFGTSSAVVLPAAFIMGLGQGAETGLASYYISRFCGLRAYGSIFGVIMALVTLSAGIFPAFAGYVFDRTGSYDAILPLVDAMLAVPPLAILSLPAYRFKAVPLALVQDIRPADTGSDRSG